MTLKAYHKLHSKPMSFLELKEAMQVIWIWTSLPQKPINEAVESFIKLLKTGVNVGE